MSRPRMLRMSFGRRVSRFRPSNENFAADLGALVIQQPQQSERDGALAGSAFAHQAQDFAFRDFELDILQDSRLVRIVNGQVAL